MWDMPKMNYPFLAKSQGCLNTNQFKHNLSFRPLNTHSYLIFGGFSGLFRTFVLRLSCNHLDTRRFLPKNRDT